ncbi:hypothetical protein EVG20_g4769 [Dentipellis fragilis]|uniref:Ubiquitin 3 binding protein But2 C-terminal domain-containing protein n=1 Tax=Dentipellis fragilis TaxID=205917 RepID=A0A4Y9YX36_9AGAM|nr:hypothetical protein EVG20_g4769 [Dentipellis fragilis]
MADHSEYSSLPQDDEQAPLVDEKPEPEAVEITGVPSNGPAYRIIRLATLIIVVCTVIDSLLFLQLGLRYWKASTPVDPDSLELRNPYIGFDDLYRNKSRTSPHGPIFNLGRALMQVSSAEPNKVFPQWPDSWMSPDGLVPMGDRHLLISTIAQFRVRDYGMGNCSFTLEIPAKGDVDAPQATISGTGESVQLDIWLLSTERRLKFHELSWKTKPARQKHLGTWTASPGTSQYLPGYACTSGSYQTVEVTCSTPGCLLDMNVKDRKRFGLFLKQYQTI